MHIITKRGIKIILLRKNNITIKGSNIEANNINHSSAKSNQNWIIIPKTEITRKQFLLLLRKTINDQIVTALNNTKNGPLKLAVDQMTWDGKNIAINKAILAILLLKVSPIL